MRYFLHFLSSAFLTFSECRNGHLLPSLHCPSLSKMHSGVCHQSHFPSLNVKQGGSPGDPEELVPVRLPSASTDVR